MPEEERAKQAKVPAEKRPNRRPSVIDQAIRNLRKGKSHRRQRELDRNMRERWPLENHWQMTTEKAWVAMPKDVPLVMAVLDEIADAKAARTYLALLAQTWEGVPMVTIRDEDEAALWCGFGGKRRRYVFRDALEKLEKLGFVRIVGHPGEVRDVLMRKPKAVIKDLQANGTLSAASSQAYRFWDHVQVYRDT